MSKRAGRTTLKIRGEEIHREGEAGCGGGPIASTGRLQ
jgi:hypothetical protein